MNKPKLEKCPFCGRVPKIVPCDDEGNVHLETGYEENPWSGLGYQITHEVLTEDAADDCPIASFKGETTGTNIYDTREEAIATWNRRAPPPDNKANILLPLEMLFGRGVFGVAGVAADESAPIREILIYRLPDPVLPIGSNLGDKGKHVEELENVIVRMHFENAESAHVLERVVRVVLDSFEEPDNKALTEGDRIRAMSDEKLAAFLDALCTDGSCSVCDNLYWCRRNNAPEPICKNHICDWLKKHTGEE